MIRIEGKQSLAAFALVGFSFLAPAAVTAADVSYVFSTLAGVAGTLVSSADGTGSAAQFSAPRGLAVDSVAMSTWPTVPTTAFARLPRPVS
ncbi:MAG: hypothetical protein IPG23_21730 [Burkholderiales bacterium]|nr:hypothetical protein [Burkholderiales bacterium]